MIRFPRVSRRAQNKTGRTHVFCRTRLDWAHLSAASSYLLSLIVYTALKILIYPQRPAENQSTHDNMATNTLALQNSCRKSHVKFCVGHGEGCRHHRSAEHNCLIQTFRCLFTMVCRSPHCVCSVRHNEIIFITFLHLRPHCFSIFICECQRVQPANLRSEGFLLRVREEKVIRPQANQVNGVKCILFFMQDDFFCYQPPW